MSPDPSRTVHPVEYLEAFADRFELAIARVGVHTRTLLLAGRHVELRFAGDALLSVVMPALAHRQVPETARPDATILLGDTASTGVKGLPLPRPRAMVTRRGDIRGFFDQSARASFHHGELSLFDAKQARGLSWVQDAALVPGWTIGCPLRSIVGWLLESWGLQLVHAAAIANEQGALLFPERSGMGKSTIALNCLAAGFDFLGDDQVAVELSPQPRVFGIYGTAKVVPGQEWRFPQLRSAFLPQGDIPKRIALLYPGFAAQLPHDAPLRGVVLPRLVPGEETRIRSCSELDAFHAAAFPTLSEMAGAAGTAERSMIALSRDLPRTILEMGSNTAAVIEACRQLCRPLPGIPPEPSPAEELEHVTVILGPMSCSAELEHGLRAVAEQGYPDLDVIAIAAPGVRVAAELLPPFELLPALPSKVASLALAQQTARGPLIAFLGAGESWQARMLHRASRRLRCDSEVDVVSGFVQISENANHSTCWALVSGHSPRYLPAAGLHRARAFEKAGSFDDRTTHGAETEWFERATGADVRFVLVAERALVLRPGDGLELGDRFRWHSYWFERCQRAIELKRGTRSASGSAPSSVLGKNPDTQPQPTGRTANR